MDSNATSETDSLTLAPASSATVEDGEEHGSPPSRRSPTAGLRERRQAFAEGRAWVLLSLAMDAVMLALAVVAALFGARAAGVESTMLVWFFPPLVMAMLSVRGMYRSKITLRIIDEAARVVSVTSIAAMTILVLAVVVGDTAQDAQLIARVWVFSMLYVAGGRLVVGLTERRARREGSTGTPTLILGAGRIGALVERRLLEQPEFGLRPVGYVDPHPPSSDQAPGRELPVLGGPADLADIVERTGARHVVLAFLSSRGSDARLVPIVRQCDELGLDVSLVPRLFESITVRMQLEHIGGMPLFRLRPVRPNGWQFAIKYALDRIVAALMVATLAPVIIAAAIAVKLSSPGPLFFRQRRVGRDDREFDMLKFRTMRGRPETEGEADAAWAAGTVGTDPEIIGPDDRRTRVGTLLRRYSLDELPQLFNVLRGDMSLIGPRPERTSYVRMFEDRVYRYGDRHRVKAGLTGWAQVHGLRGKTSLADRIEWDNFYIENWSLWLDFKILIMTIAAVFKPSE